MGWYERYLDGTYDLALPFYVALLWWFVPVIIAGMINVRRWRRELPDKPWSIRSQLAFVGGFGLLGAVAELIAVAAATFVQPALAASAALNDIGKSYADWARAGYQWLDAYLGPATNYILYAAIVVFGWWLAMFSPLSKNRSLPRLFLFIAMMFMTGFVIHHAALNLIRNPVSVVHYLGFLLATLTFFPKLSEMLARDHVANMGDFMWKTGAQRGFFTSSAGLAFAGLSLLVACSYWYRLEFSAEIQIAFYASAIGGLLAVIGFAALVFTFTYETITVMNVRRVIQGDSQTFQLASLIVIITSMFGLALSDGPIILDASSPRVSEAVRSALFVSAFSGALVATTSVLLMYMNVTSELIKRGVEHAEANYRFYDEATSVERSSSSRGERGLSIFSNCLEVRQCNVERVSLSKKPDLLGTPRVVLVLPSLINQLTEHEKAFFREVTSAGSVLLVLTDADDYRWKSELLSSMGVPPAVIVIDKKPLPLYLRAMEGSLEKEIVGTVIQPVCFPKQEGVLSLMSTLPQSSPGQQCAEDVVVARSYGKGWVVAFGSLATLENLYLRKNRRHRQVTSLVQAIRDIIPPDPAPGRFRA